MPTLDRRLRSRNSNKLPARVRELFESGTGAEHMQDAELIRLWVAHGSEFCRAGLFVRGCWIMEQPAALIRVAGQEWPGNA
ncbi:hypothetical protein [Pseudomonas sp.]|uniref:hypothetical protein n=1 Tax=Pseudomonas sp. TaxID=306 RepID=UPI002736D0DF|nr:hypothetical protein [Pseudomonas sp.]MDP3816689.1 hypothetical protein [Pseudomonas sp.]